MFRVLIVEDDRNLADTLAKLLIADDYDPEVVHDGSEGFEKASENQYDVILLDWMLPGLDGISICKKLKEMGSQTPIIMISAKDAATEKIIGLDAGADDYLAKPFLPQELIARIRAVTRRATPFNGDRIRFGNLDFVHGTGELSCGSTSISLSEKESALMYELIKEPGHTCSKEDLLDSIWAEDHNADANNVEAYISFLRKKLNHLGTNVQIKTLRKQGYKLDVEQ